MMHTNGVRKIIGFVLCEITLRRAKPKTGWCIYFNVSTLLLCSLYFLYTFSYFSLLKNDCQPPLHFDTEYTILLKADKQQSRFWRSLLGPCVSSLFCTTFASLYFTSFYFTLLHYIALPCFLQTIPFYSFAGCFDIVSFVLCCVVHINWLRLRFRLHVVTCFEDIMKTFLHFGCGRNGWIITHILVRKKKLQKAK